MKNGILILFILLAFGACKDDSQLEPDAGVVYEDWKILSDSTIRYGYRNIVATELVGNQLYVQAQNAHYMLDSNLVLDEDNYNVMQRTDIRYPHELVYNVKHNDNYILFPESEDQLIIRDAKRIRSSQIEGHIHIPSLVDDYGSGYGQNYCSSDISEDNTFDVALLSYEGNSAVYTVITFQINHTPGEFQKIEIEEIGRVVVARDLDEGRYASRRSSIKCWRIGSLRYVWIARICKLYRYQGNTLLDVKRYNVGNILDHKGQLIAGSNYVYYFADSLQRDDGLILSEDKGSSWKQQGYGNELSQFPIKSLGGQLVIYAGHVISIIDLEKGGVDKVNLNGLDAAIHSIEKVGNKVVVGTDAGVYYKSWESFLNK
jgi:hypothetical protein